MLNRTTKKDLRLRFFISIKYDADRWTVHRHNNIGWSWSDYRSPEYDNIQFGIDGMDKQCVVFIDSHLVYKFKANMFKLFSEITPILEMKRIVDEKDIISYNNSIRDSINNIDIEGEIRNEKTKKNN